jgi:ATP-dependent Clp protease ATP-binding subunit ClpC
LLVSELDGNGAFDFYLAPLLRQAKARSWKLELHVHGEGQNGTFGSAHGGKAFLELLTAPDRSFRHVVLRVIGENAGAWLGLEAGLHRFVAAADGDDASLFVRLAARRAALTEHELGTLLPPLPDVIGALLKQKTIRTFEEEHVTVRSGSTQTKVVMNAASYWDRFETVVVRHLLAREQAAGEQPIEIDALFGDEPTAPPKGSK